MSDARHAILRTCSLLLWFVAGSLELSIIDFHVPPVVIVGKNVELKCMYLLGDDDVESTIVVKWFWTPASAENEDRIVIYQRIEGRSPVIYQRHTQSAIDVKEDDSIVLQNIQALSSGMYECAVSSFVADVRKRGSLIVFSEGTGPIVSLKHSERRAGPLYESKQVQVMCRADDVTPKPSLQVTVNGRDFDASTIIEDYDNNGLYKATANIMFNAEDVEGTQIQVRCEMSFSDSNIALLPYVAVKTFTLS